MNNFDKLLKDLHDFYMTQIDDKKMELIEKAIQAIQTLSNESKLLNECLSEQISILSEFGEVRSLVSVSDIINSDHLYKRFDRATSAVTDLADRIYKEKEGLNGF